MENNSDSNGSSDSVESSSDCQDSTSINIISFCGSSLIESPIVKAVLASGGLLGSSSSSASSATSSLPERMNSPSEIRNTDNENTNSRPPTPTQILCDEDEILVKLEEDDDEAQQRCFWDSCDRRFPSNSDALVNHVNDDHVRVDKEIAFTCRWQGCPRRGKAFNARYKMLIHIRTHTNEKPHRCSHCQKSFSRLENLKIHYRSHTGERPYSCPVQGCNKAYSNSSDRFKHTRTHFTNKPYVCKRFGCDKKYTDPSSLRKHMKTYGHYREDRDRLLPNNTLRSQVSNLGGVRHSRSTEMSAAELGQLESALVSAAASAVFGNPFTSSEIRSGHVIGAWAADSDVQATRTGTGMVGSRSARSPCERGESSKPCRTYQASPLDLSCGSSLATKTDSQRPTDNGLVTAGDGYSIKWGYPIGSN